MNRLRFWIQENNDELFQHFGHEYLKGMSAKERAALGHHDGVQVGGQRRSLKAIQNFEIYMLEIVETIAKKISMKIRD